MVEMQTAHLIVKRGPTLHTEFVLNQAETTLGRGTINSIVLADQEVSRRHARILFDATGYMLEDFGSTNGTYVNGRRISGSVHLQNGDQIALGEAVILQFESADSPLVDEPALNFTESAPSTAFSTGDTPPKAISEPPTARPEPQPVKSQAANDAAWEDIGQPSKSRGFSIRRLFWGCGCLFFLLVFFCMASLFFLDAYQGGRLLYCGPIRPFFEFMLGPFGFAPICP